MLPVLGEGDGVDFCLFISFYLEHELLEHLFFLFLFGGGGGLFKKSFFSSYFAFILLGSHKTNGQQV